MKNITIHLFCILFSLFVFNSDSFAMAPSGKTAQLSPTAAQDLKSAKAKITGEAQLDFSDPSEKNESGWDFLFDNWGLLALSFVTFLEVGARLTPTEKDNTVLKILSTVLNMLIPNLKKGGGIF